MMNLIDFIDNESLVNEMLDVNSELILEKLEAKVLKKLASQLTKQIEKEKEENSSKSWRPSLVSKNFRKIFGSSYISWSKVRDEDIEEIEPNEKNDKLVRAVLRGKRDAIILVVGDDGEFELYIDDRNGEVISLKKTYGNYPGSTIGSRWNKVPEASKIEMTKGKKLYVINNTNNLRQDTYKTQSDRRQSKAGMVLMDPHSLKDLAYDNIKRYKNIIAKKKAEELDNDDLIDEVNDVIKKCANLASKIAKDPSTYADSLSVVSQLVKYVYDERSWIQGRGSQSGYYVGVDGLLPTLMRYIDALNDIKKTDLSKAFANSSYYMNTLKACKEKLEKSLASCKKLMEKLDILID